MKARTMRTLLPELDGEDDRHGYHKHQRDNNGGRAPRAYPILVVGRQRPCGAPVEGRRGSSRCCGPPGGCLLFGGRGLVMWCGLRAARLLRRLGGLRPLRGGICGWLCWHHCIRGKKVKILKEHN